MLVAADSFNRYGTNINLLLNGLYANVSGAVLVADPDGVSPGNVIQFQHNQGFNFISRVLPRVTPINGICIRQWMTSLPVNGEAPLIGWMDDIGQLQVWITFTSSGRVTAFCKNSSAQTVQIGESAIPVVTANAWWHLELFVDLKTDGTGTLQLNVEGAPVLTLTAVPFVITGVYLACFGSQVFESDSIPFFKTFVLWDGTGSDNNSSIGAVQVDDLYPVADVQLNWLTTGTNGFSVLANNPPNDSEYLTAGVGPIPAAYECTLSSLPVNVSSVQGIFTRVRAGKVDGGDGSLQMGVISDAVPQTGVSRPITVAQTYYEDLFEIDPHTDAAWTVGAVNAVTVSMNRTV